LNDTDKAVHVSSIFSVKSNAPPAKRKADAMDIDGSSTDKKKTRRGGGKKIKK
jgi:hypothetical protein